MAVTPQITVQGKLVDLFGAAEPGSLLVQLCGFGSQVPRIIGTAMIAETAPLSFEADAGSVAGNYSFTLWGNDVITPGPDVTFYTITIVDANGNLVQVNAYQWNGTQTVDLATATPYIPPPPPPPGYNTWIEITSVAGVLTIPAGAGRNFWTTLHENVTSVVVNLAVPGQDYWFFFVQNGSGNWTVAWGGALLNPIDPVNPVTSGFTLQPAKCLPTGQMMAAGYYP